MLEIKLYTTEETTLADLREFVDATSQFPGDLALSNGFDQGAELEAISIVIQSERGTA